MLKILQARLQQYVHRELPMFKLVLAEQRDRLEPENGIFTKAAPSPPSPRSNAKPPHTWGRGEGGEMRAVFGAAPLQHQIWSFSGEPLEVLDEDGGLGPADPLQLLHIHQS